MLEICAIAQQPAHIAELSESEHRRQTLFRGEFGGLLDVKECQGVDQDKEPVGVPGGEPSAALFSVRLRRIKYIVADRA